MPQIPINFSEDIFRKPPKEVQLGKVDELFLSFGGTPQYVDNWQAIALTALALYEERTRRPKIWTPDGE